LEDVVCLCGPNKGFWVLIVAVDVVSDGHDELLEILEDSAPNQLGGQVAEESFNHVEPRCGCRREAHMEALVLFEPALHVFMFVRCIVVTDKVNLFVSGNCLIDHAQEAKPFLMAMLLLTQAEDLAISRVESGEQGGRAVALVVKRHGGATALFHRQTRLGAVQSLYLTLLVHRQHQRMFGRVEIESHDGFQLVRVAGKPDIR